MLGGRVRERIECYAWIHGGEPAGYAEDAQRRLEEGFRTVKFTPIEGTGIAIDAHGLLNPINAVEMARRIGRYAFRDLLVHEAVNVIHKIAAMAEAFYVSLAPHNPWSPLSTAISLHLDPVIPNFLIQEIPTAGAHADRARLLQ